MRQQGLMASAGAAVSDVAQHESPDLVRKPSTPAHTREAWGFRPDIEGMRAVAIVLVVAYHVAPALVPRGFLGVDVFFVISGFLIIGLLVDEIRRTGSVRLDVFWARRARRLLPAAAVVALATLGLFACIESPFFASYGRTAMAYAVFATNIRFLIHGNGDYFDAATAEDPFLHTWSLSVEEQFYIVVAPAMWLLTRGKEFGAFTRRGGRIILLVTVTSLLAAIVLVERFPIATFYLLPTRMWELGVGALLALWLPWIGKQSRAFPSFLPTAAVVVLVGVAVWPSSNPEWRPSVALVAVSSTAALIVGGIGHRGITTRVLSTKPMMTIGRLSYSWYLWHWPLLVATRLIVGKPSIAVLGGVALLSLALSAATFVFVESPVRRSRWLSHRPKRSLALGGALSLSILAAAVVALVVARSDRRRPGLEFVRAAQELPIIYANGCHSGLATVQPERCDFGAPDADTTIALFGDSHAAQWFPALQDIADRRRWRLASYTKSGCPSFDVTIGFGVPARRNVACDVWRRAAVANLIRRRASLVVLSNSDGYLVASGGRWWDMSTSSDARVLWGDGLRRTVRTLADSGLAVLVIRDVPKLVQNPSRCAARRLRNSDCALVYNDTLERTLWEAETRILAERPGTMIADLGPRICDRLPCSAIRGGILTYRDYDHLSIQFARSLARDLEPFLRPRRASASR
jgi:peptidoglycan/LPS O-acetylase OafA/YrhL